jgi:hypothetical protein
MRSKQILLLVTFTLVATHVDCRAPKATKEAQNDNRIAQGNSSATPLADPEISVPDLIKNYDFIEGNTRKGMLRAWSRVPNNHTYRVAQTSDSESPIIRDYGEIAGAHGLVTLIVDKTVLGPNRMSLIVFIKRPNNRSDIFWIYRDMDLSKYKIGRSSGDIFVEEAPQIDGSKYLCEIRWDKKDKKWGCRGF